MENFLSPRGKEIASVTQIALITTSLWINELFFVVFCKKGLTSLYVGKPHCFFPCKAKVQWLGCRCLFSVCRLWLKYRNSVYLQIRAETQRLLTLSQHSISELHYRTASLNNNHCRRHCGSGNLFPKFVIFCAIACLSYSLVSI